jgi:glucosamine 6-phosphate synthetase-like amidotransferase/phosphosugar isomerase protein
VAQNYVLVGRKYYLVTTVNGASKLSRISKQVAERLIAGGMNHGS